MSAYVTKHARGRMKQRLGLPKRTLQKMADRALVDGRRHQTYVGQFKRYLDALYLEHGKANNMRVLGEHIFLFNIEIEKIDGEHHVERVH